MRVKARYYPLMKDYRIKEEPAGTPDQECDLGCRCSMFVRVKSMHQSNNSRQNVQQLQQPIGRMGTAGTNKRNKTCYLARTIT